MQFLRLTGLQIRELMGRKEFLFSFTLMLIYCVAIGIFNINNYFGMDVQLLPEADSMFCGNANTKWSWILIFLLAILSAVPAAMSVADDRSAGLIPLTMTRAGRGRYCFSKLTACFLLGFLVFFIPFCVNIAINAIVFPSEELFWLRQGFTFGDDTAIQYHSDHFVWSSLYYASPLLYNVFSAAVFSIFAGAAGVFSCGFAWLFQQNKYRCIVPFFCLYLITDGLSNILIKLPSGEFLFMKDNGYYADYFSLRNNLTGQFYEAYSPTAGPVYVAILIAVLLAAGVILTWIQIRRDDLD